jgi:hypothetical protein
MLEVRTLGVGTDYLCSGCVDDLFRLNTVDLVTFHARAGAPPEWVASFGAKLRTGPLLRSGLPPAIWGEILTDAIEETLPVEARWEALVEQAILAGTLPPDFLTAGPASSDLL